MKIIVVEDEGVVAQNIRNRCEMLGYSVPAVFSSGEQVLEYIKKDLPDLVLMDIRLSGALDGIETAVELRKRKDIPVVFLTAYVDDETIERAKAAEPYGYIVKPFSFADMRANIEIAIHNHKLHLQRQKAGQQDGG